MAIALVTVWSAIAASYSTDYPVGFFVGAISAAAYALGRGWAAWRRRSAAATHRRNGSRTPLSIVV